LIEYRSPSVTEPVDP